MPTAIIAAQGCEVWRPPPKGFSGPAPKSMGPSLVTTEVAHSRRVGQAPTLYTDWLESGAPLNAQLGLDVEYDIMLDVPPVMLSILFQL